MDGSNSSSRGGWSLVPSARDTYVDAASEEGCRVGVVASLLTDRTLPPEACNLRFFSIKYTGLLSPDVLRWNDMAHTVLRY